MIRKITPRSFFKQYVATISLPPDADKRFLPLIHGTAAVFLRDILAEGEIKLPEDPCEVLDQRLVFTFYGRPSYQRSGSGEALTRTSGAPTYILLKPAVMKSAALAHPLDTGAFKEELYKGHIDRAFQARDFGFEATQEGVLKVVFNFFGGNTGYMGFQPRKLNVEQGQHEALAYLDVINSRDAAKVDVRDSSIEVALRDGIPLDRDHVQCVILPDVLLDSESYGKDLRARRIDIRSYRFTPPLDGAAHAGRILDCVLTYYQEKGLL